MEKGQKMKAPKKKKIRHELATKREQIRQLKHALLETTNRLNECAGELHCMIDMKNAELETGIGSSDINPPDYFDAQTAHEAMVQCKISRDLLTAIK